MRLGLLTLLLIVSGHPAEAVEQAVRFTNATNAPPMRAALDLLRSDDKHANVRLSEVSAAFVTLVDGKPQQLVVQLTGDNCGSLGCSVTLYERGVRGWLPMNDWIIGSIGILPEVAGAGWHNLLLNHESTWKHLGSHYVLAERR